MKSVALAGLMAAVFTLASRPPDIPFEKRTLDLGANEAAAFADINGDGRLDIVSGENWYEAPHWKQHRFREFGFANNYIDDFSDLPIDADGDGKVDIVSCSWFAQSLTYWKNPGKTGAMWKPQVIQGGAPVEFCFLVDMDNDGKAHEILPQFGNTKQPLAWYEFKNGAWQTRQVSERSWGHGIGTGDVNKDGRTDVLVQSGWFEAPADPRKGTWTWHPEFESFGFKATSYIHVVDADGDGRNDVILGMAHDYGLFWLRNEGDGKWAKVTIDDSWSQAHAVHLVDLNGDGQLDILTGKRFMAHNGKDPGEREPLGIYWFEWRKTPDGKRLDFARHIIDLASRTGAGMQLAVADYDKDGDLDIVAPGKSGLFLFENKTK